MVKKYISADLRVIDVNANDIITGSPTVGYGTGKAGSMDAPGRRDMFDDSYDEF